MGWFIRPAHNYRPIIYKSTANIATMLQRPINENSYRNFKTSTGRVPTPKLQALYQLLAKNRQAQESIKSMYSDISRRLALLRNEVSTYRLKKDYPPAEHLLNYVKFDRRVPNAFKEQYAIKKTSEEDTRITQNLRKYSRTRHLKFEGLSDNPTREEFIAYAKHFKQEGGGAGTSAYRAWLKKKRESEKEGHIAKEKRAYSKYYKELLQYKYEIYGDNWYKISQHFYNRSFEELYYDFHNRLNPELSRIKSWNNRESIILIVLYEHFGPKRWAIIAKIMKSRSELQVRYRFCNILDPVLTYNIWPYNLSARLLVYARNCNYYWKKLVKMYIFKTKTDNSIWRKFRNIMIKRTYEYIFHTLEDNPKLAKKIVDYKRSMERAQIRS